MTGHRRLDHPEDISVVVQEVLGEILRDRTNIHRPPSSEKPPTLMAISPLAEGADRLVAREILATEGGGLKVVLPLAENEFRRDFITEDSHRDFSDFLKVADSVMVLDETPTRSAAYEAAGHQVVDQCDILIAIWDGNPARGRGGTEKTVAYARRVGKPLYLIDSSHPHKMTREGIPRRNG